MGQNVRIVQQIAIPALNLMEFVQLAKHLSQF
jgi:hypothetical protein